MNVQHVARTLPPIAPCAAPATDFVVDMGTAAARRDTTAPWRCRKRGRGRGRGKGADGEADCGTTCGGRGSRGRDRGRGRGIQPVDKEVESNTGSESDT